MFVIILAIVTLSIATCAAFFSVFGIGHLFAGAMIPVMIMASSLEAGKLMTVSFLYRYWNVATKTLKMYMIIASVVLMVITSVGIYGFLTAAYAKVAAVPQTQMNQMALIDSQKVTLNETIKRNQTRLEQLEISRRASQGTLDSVVRKLHYGNNTTTRNIQRQLDAIDRQQSSLQTDNQSLAKRRDSLDVARTGYQNSVSTDEKLGTFIYVANAFGVPLDKVVKWFTFLLVIVFDPLSVSLVLAYNTIVKQKIAEPINVKKSAIEPVNDEKVSKKERKPIIRVKKSAPKKQLETSTGNIIIPYWLQEGYDWDKETEWKKNPQAVAYYKQTRIDKGDKP